MAAQLNADLLLSVSNIRLKYIKIIHINDDHDDLLHTLDFAYC